MPVNLKRRKAADRPKNPFDKIRRRKFHVLTVPLCERMIRETWANYSAIARMLGLTQAAVSKYVHQHPHLIELAREYRECVQVDCAEWQLRDALFAGEPWAIKMVLENYGRSRGWGRSVQIGGPPQPDGSMGPVPVQIYIPANGREFRPPAITQGEVADDGPASVGERAGNGSAEIRPDGSE
jgi:hypothetical protein